MKNKTLLWVILAAVVVGIATGAFLALWSPQQEEDVVVQVAALKGPTGIGMSYLMEQQEGNHTKNDYQFTLAASPDEITGKLLSGEIQIAACPVNLASTLYHKSNGKIQVAAVNTSSVLYILENGNNIQKIEDLKGKTIHATGQGATPEYILNFLLEENGLEPGKDVQIEYVADHSALAALAVSGDAPICMLPEPNVTAAQMKNPDLRVALDFNQEWNQLTSTQGTDLVQGCIVVNADFAAEHKGIVDTFLEEYEASVDFVLSNNEEAAKLVAAYDILADEELAEQAIPKCAITCVTGNEMKTSIEKMLRLLFEANPQSIGGSMPDETFYYQK